MLLSEFGSGALSEIIKNPNDSKSPIYLSGLYEKSKTYHCQNGTSSGYAP
jgi:hypothetical protein